MKWHRNPFFHTAVLPPSVAPSAMASARPSADLESATAAAVAASSAAAAATPQNNDNAAGRSSTEPLSPRMVSHGLLAEAATRAAASSGSRLRRRRPKAPPRLTICEPSDHLTGYQFFYIFGLDGLGAFILSGGINFAIAYAMYRTIDSNLHPIRLFQFPNTLAGDATVTIFIQTVMTWFIELVLVNRDLRSGHVQPIGFIKEPSMPLLRWFLLLDRLPKHDEAGGSGDDSSHDNNDADEDLRRPLSAPHHENCRCDRHVERYEPGSWKHWAAFLVSQLIRALLVGVLAFVVLWGPTIGILTAVGDHRTRDWWFDSSSWAPPIFKLIFGGVLALLTTPPFAAFWLVRCGWAVQANERHLAGET
ncbi:hypothetical protein SPI_08329 [Niveomyces insectorum RCEF 264]|uniref:Uncharacterized protein n=1 Tax=Niveomyces insectorum RCEF 264 TaxID=1081102 RepID=A0A167N7W2_9HYPO|nr:hypothetical protein SPI_08329 [Niveomyces insectorum RCEF 264]